MSITWNGVSSDTIGVIVERIPNRHVPTRRFSPQQVAGRNGNILLVDKSFPNVEQEYEVYLSAEAQGLPSVARACAEWLMGPDGYCRLEDSYDTTVYREAFLMGGYDLENILNKFGRCTITFSCKPQKYLLTGDTPIEIPAGITTYTGDVVQFDGVTGASITSLSTTITSTQAGSGDPSPTNVRPITGLTGLSVYRTGKNLLDASNCVDNIYPDGGAMKFSSVGGASVFYASVKPNTTYTLSANNGDRTIICSCDTTPASGVAIKRIIFSSSSLLIPQTFTTAADETLVALYVNRYARTKPTEIQLELGSTSTTYEPYNGNTYAVDWTSEAGTVYGGTVDVVTGVLTVDRAMVDLGTLNWGYSASAAQFRASLNYAKDATSTEVPNMECEIYKTVSYAGMANNDMCISRFFASVDGINVKDSRYTDAATFKTAMSGVQLCYELATPLTYQLSAQEIEVLAGENNVWTSSGPVSVTVEAPFVGTVTNPTPFEARPMLEVSGVGEITINGKSIQILESVSDFQIDCEAMEAEDNSKIYCMDFPELSGGENEIVGDGSITALTVTPRWWIL